MVKGDAKPILKISDLINLEEDIKAINKLIKNSYEDVLLMYKHDKHVHLNSSLSCLPILAVLISKYIRRSENDIDRDWLILSKGHAAPALYAILAEVGVIPKSELPKINRIDSILQNHTDISTPSIDFSSGSLGQGISFAIGVATWIKRMGGKGRVFVIMGDGEQDEGQVWEAITHAASLRLNNLVVIVDWNNTQLDGVTNEIKPKHYIPLIWKIIGWKVLWASGRDIVSMIMAFDEILESDKPTVIFVQTSDVRKLLEAIASHGAH